MAGTLVGPKLSIDLGTELLLSKQDNSQNPLGERGHTVVSVKQQARPKRQS